MLHLPRAVAVRPLSKGAAAIIVRVELSIGKKIINQLMKFSDARDGALTRRV
jgi:hypothetical protein